MRVAHLEKEGYFGSRPGPEIRVGLGGIVVPDFVEKFLGNVSEEEVVKESGGATENPRAVSYISGIGQKLVSVSGRPKYGYKFGIVNADEVNAFALPNGSIYATTGLLKRLRTEAQLANVLGHEVGHVTERHGIEQMGINIGALTFLGIVGNVIKKSLSKEDLEAAKGLVFAVVSNGYSRGNESESDDVGQNLAVKAGWDPKGMVEVMEIFAQLEKGAPEGFEKYFRSHPYARDRVKEANRRLPSLPKGDVGRERYARFLVEDLGLPAGEVLAPGEKYPTGALLAGEFPLSGLLIGAGALAVLVAIMILTRK